MSSSIIEKVKKKRKKEGKKFKGQGLRIVDDADAIPDYTTYLSKKQDKGSDSDGYNEAEELPQIVAVKDDRPEHVKIKEQYSNNRWKQLGRKDVDDSDGDNPPVQIKLEGGGYMDLSSPHKKKRSKKQGSDDDLSPPRSSSKALVRRKGSDDDLSPPRTKRRIKREPSDEDLSPPRLKGRDRDLSPPRIRRGRDSDGDLSPPRPPKRRFDTVEGDLSPPRHRGRRGSGSPPVRRSYIHRRDTPPPSHRPPSSSYRGGESELRIKAEPEIIEGEPVEKKRVNTAIARYLGKDVRRDKTLDGKKAGLQRGANLKEELDELRRKDDEFFAQMDEAVSGRNAKTLYRDKETGKLRDLEKERQDKLLEDEKAAERKQVYDKWGRGLKQVGEQQAKLEEALHEIAKPLARYKDDEDLDDYLKKQEREGDPMLKFLEKKKEKARGGGPRKPRYTGPAPLPNRFGIPPGYRWDGVDRSNGYEKQWFNRINTKSAVLDEAYKWSVEDM